jgi:pyruvyltransferase
MKIVDRISALKDFVIIHRKRNYTILTDNARKVAPNCVNLHYWRKNTQTGQEDNLGDYLSVVVVERLKAHYHIEEKRLSKTKHLYAIGSIIQAGFQNATVWGSGFLNNPLTGRLACLFQGRLSRKLDIRAVRGPLTREALIRLGHNCPEVFGDPAVLMPLFYAAKCEDKKQDYVVVSHYSDKTKYENSV